MASTTLVTFLLNSVHATATVDVYGSWDNFSRPYPMVKDSQKGHGSWYGCHLFTNIICDGDPANCCSPRNGALSMGGTYWYYYRRNGNDEFHNPDEPSTSQCPLLPGQIVNVLTVADCHLPDYLRGDRADQELDSLLTMDPKQRFRRPASVPVRSRRDRVSTATHRQRAMDDRFNYSLARLQTGIADTIISAYLQDRPTDELIKPRRAFNRQIITAPGRPARVWHASGHNRSISSPDKQRRGASPPSATQREAKGFFGDAASQPKGHVKEFANPFADAYIPGSNAAEALRTSTTGSISSDHDKDSRRPSTFPRARAQRYGGHAINHKSFSGMQHCRPRSGPSAFSQSSLLTSAIPYPLPEQIVSAQASESATCLSHDAQLKQASVSDNATASVDHNITSRIHNASEQAEPDQTTTTTTPNPPPTRSRSQKLKRFASLKGRFKLPPISQLPQLPKMKTWTSTKHEAEESAQKGAVFNDATSTWTPAMTSPSESSPVVMSPLIHSIPAQPCVVSSPEVYSTELPSPVLSMKDEVPQLPVAHRLEERYLPGRKQSLSKPKSQRFLRGSSLPTLFNEAAYTSSQETITQPPRRWYQKTAIKSTALDADKGTGLWSTSAYISQPLDATTADMATSHSIIDDGQRVSFDETIHREQIRQILRSSLPDTAQSEADERRNSFIMHQQQQERTSFLSSRDSDSDDDTFAFQFSHGSAPNASGFGKGAPQPLAFDVADFDESFDYLAAAIF